MKRQDSPFYPLQRIWQPIPGTLIRAALVDATPCLSYEIWPLGPKRFLDVTTGTWSFGS